MDDTLNDMHQIIEKSASEIEKATKESANAIYEAMQKSVESINIY